MGIITGVQFCKALWNLDEIMWITLHSSTTLQNTLWRWDTSSPVTQFFRNPWFPRLLHIAIVSDKNSWGSSPIFFIATHLPSPGQRLKTKNSLIEIVWSKINFFPWNNRNQVWKAGYLIYPMFPERIPFCLVLWHGLEMLQTSSNGNSVPALASPFQSITFSLLDIFNV